MQEKNHLYFCRRLDSDSTQKEMSDSADLKAAFDRAVKAMNDYSGSLSNDTKLKAYGLFKQAEKGPCTGDRPGFFDQVGRAKYDAWKALGEISADEAMTQYIELVKEIYGGDLPSI
jgi:acyl-CoA-binding protein